MPLHFREIGTYLKGKYDSATKVEIEKVKDGKKLTLKAVPKDLSYKKHDLVYTEPSPQYLYCTKRANIYSPGTVGRKCNSTIVGPGSCDYLCCGRGHKTERRTVLKNCHCKFHWCCEVRCEKCNEVSHVHTCL